MSTETLYQITKTIGDALQASVNKGLPVDQHITVETKPPGAGGQNARVLSWWLYQVTEDEFTRNAGGSPSEGNKHGEVRMPPLRLNLHFLLTPVCATPPEDQRVLGRAMRWLYENSVLQVRSSATGPADVADIVRLSIGLSDLDGLSKLWQSLRQDFRLSVGYLVRTARVQPDRVEDVERVVIGEGVIGDVPPALAEALA